MGGPSGLSRAGCGAGVPVGTWRRRGFGGCPWGIARCHTGCPHGPEEERGHGDRHGHGHGHGHGKMELPDYRQWKIEGTPLEKVQEMLAKRGLKDPWARNEAWRYMGGFAKPVTLTEVFTRGLKWGFAAFVIALGVEYTLFPPKKNGGHH